MCIDDVLASVMLRTAQMDIRSTRVEHPHSDYIDCNRQLSGGDGGEATPVPMPNTAVKLSSADGSWTHVLPE